GISSARSSAPATSSTRNSTAAPRSWGSRTCSAISISPAPPGWSTRRSICPKLSRLGKGTCLESHGTPGRAPLPPSKNATLNGGQPCFTPTETGERRRARLPTLPLQSQFLPARAGGQLVLRLRPHGGWEAGAVEIRVEVVVEVHGGVDQHPIPFAGAEQ